MDATHSPTTQLFPPSDPASPVSVLWSRAPLRGPSRWYLADKALERAVAIIDRAWLSEVSK